MVPLIMLLRSTKVNLVTVEMLLALKSFSENFTVKTPKEILTGVPVSFVNLTRLAAELALVPTREVVRATAVAGLTVGPAVRLVSPATGAKAPVGIVVRPVGPPVVPT